MAGTGFGVHHPARRVVVLGCVAGLGGWGLLLALPAAAAGPFEPVPGPATVRVIGVRGGGTPTPATAGVQTDLQPTAPPPGPQSGSGASQTFSVAILPEPATASLGASPNPAAGGQPVTFAATVVGAGRIVPTGAAEFLVGGIVVPRCAHVPLARTGSATAVATCHLRFAPGTFVALARYGGSLQVATATSGSVVEEVLTPPGRRVRR